MKVCIYSIYDTKAQSYLPPFFLQNDALAIRLIKNTVTNPEHQFSQNAEDYVLFKLGAFDDSSAKMELLSAPESLATCLELRSTTEE